MRKKHGFSLIENNNKLKNKKEKKNDDVFGANFINKQKPREERDGLQTKLY